MRQIQSSSALAWASEAYLRAAAVDAAGEAWAFPVAEDELLSQLSAAAESATVTLRGEVLDADREVSCRTYSRPTHNHTHTSRI